MTRDGSFENTRPDSCVPGFMCHVWSLCGLPVPARYHLAERERTLTTAGADDTGTSIDAAVAGHASFCVIRLERS